MTLKTVLIVKAHFHKIALWSVTPQILSLLLSAIALEQMKLPTLQLKGGAQRIVLRNAFASVFHDWTLNSSILNKSRKISNSNRTVALEPQPCSHHPFRYSMGAKSAPLTSHYLAEFALVLSYSPFMTFFLWNFAEAKWLFITKSRFIGLTRENGNEKHMDRVRL